MAKEETIFFHKTQVEATLEVILTLSCETALYCIQLEMRKIARRLCQSAQVRLTAKEGLIKITLSNHFYRLLRPVDKT